MTASLTRNGKGKASAGRCCFWPTFPQRQPRRISNLVPHAGVHSVDPNTPSSPAGFPYIFLPQGTHVHPGLVALPGSGAVLETPVAASLVAASSLAGAPGGHVVERVGSDVTAIFLLSITKRDQLGGDLLRDGAQRLPGVGLIHVPNMEQANVERVAPAYVNPRR